MGDDELKELLKTFITTEEKRRKKRETWYLTIFSTLTISIIGFIFWLGSANQRVSHLEDDAIMKSSEEWQNNEFKTRVTYNKVFDLPPSIRGSNSTE